ncbi:DUF1552 domain-containing protein [Luteolibacter pohnpeiensis]|uniref:DUF1552 domain-containing protein n=1 Tax=Luteolibacter pohnpeiensis TaxID=454153 RepID=A0A934VWR4_9BACT|nr:DUF1552 domain-containing protein [Luteolibacter pohnpeiensis]MBK1882784.1 DUF1552 domain-containing protein [Luteolibacter pohnpeiensis]
MTSSRRNFLKGIATTLALPSLQSLGAATATAAKASKAAAPLRMAFVYIPNGVNLDLWQPKDAQNTSETLKPLANLRDHYSVMRGLDQEKAFANGDGPGDHARANATFLTGCQARKTAGADIEVGMSVDQIAARQIGHLTRVPSLELSTDPPRRSGQCDSGYSCAYQFNLSWRGESTPAPAERDPRLVFEKLFGSGNQEEDAKRRHYEKSILDFVLDDAKRLNKRLDGTDRGKMDEYLTSVRDVEMRIAQAEKFRVEVPEDQKPNGIPETYQEHIRLMYQMMALAFQTDTTRIASFLLAHDGSNRTFPEIGVTDAHHQLSHHRNNAEILEKIGRIDQFYVEQFAWFLEKLRTTQEDESNLLERSMIVYGGGIGDGNRHNHNDLPLLLAGHGNGTLSQGRVITAQNGTPMTNLYLSMLDRMNVKAERIGDSNGKFEVIA